jgi:hypothetical protein
MNFSVKCRNTKVRENFPRFPESIRTQLSEFVCGRYDHNAKLDKDKSEPDDMT